MIRMRDEILKKDMPPQRRFVLTAPLPGCDVAESSAAAAARAPKSQYDFVDTVEAGQGLICSPNHNAQTIAKDADRAEDVGYVRALHASEHRMMTSIEEDNASQSLGEGLRRLVQPARACSYTDFMKFQHLNFKETKGVVGLSQWLKKMESIFHISGCAIDNQVKFATCNLLGAVLTWWNGHVRTLGHVAAYAMTWGTLRKKLMDKYCQKCFQELALMCTKFLADETKKVDKYISGLPDNIYRNVVSARPKTLDETIELANNLMDQKLHTYAERQNYNKRKADDSSRNNQQHQPHKKNVHSSVENARGHIKKNYPKVKNRGNGSGNGVAQGRAYAFGGIDASLDSNVITDPTKIESIKDWASPKSLTKIYQFLGLAGYYKIFVEGFSKIAKSMTKLTRNNVKFDWGEKEETAF
nr:hypothetical protein [Tanacetum cinerariifolium]